VSSEVFDLSSARADRARARAARREGRGDTLKICFGGEEIAEIGAEFPLDVLSPLQDVNLDLALLVRQALDLMNAEGTEEQVAVVSFIVDVLAANPSLPTELITAIGEMGKRLLGPEGYAAFLAQRPTPWDIAALATHLMNWYGVSLGESSGSSTPVTGGGTSNPTSNPTSESTPEISGGIPATPDSSESAA
jgi:hypothetical protein